MTKNFKFVIWILAVAVFAASVGYMLPSRPMPDTTQSVPTGRGSVRKAVEPKVQQPAAASPIVSSQEAPASELSKQTTAPASPAAPAKPAVSLPDKGGKISYKQLLEYLNGDISLISKIVFKNGSDTVIVHRKSRPHYEVVVPEDVGKAELRRKAEELKIYYEVQSTTADDNPYMRIGIIVGVFVVGLLIFTYFSRRQGGAAAGARNGTSNFGQTTAKDVADLGDSVPKVTFNDVAGCDEAVKELKRVVFGFSKQIVYDSFDAKLPRGILLLGPPGTGKTLLATAVAGECDGTMQVLSGSDFVEMYVGVGAARVRDTFAKGRLKVKETGKPHVIFIDEIDAVGGKRGNGVNSNTEREQTLNALLVEMNGVNNNKGIIVIAATNRVDMLDEALVRPGRFDCHISVDMPDKTGREKIFAIHTRKKPLAKNVNPAILAARSYGYSGAEIAGACDRAALIAAERWAEIPGAAEVLAKWDEAAKLRKDCEAEEVKNNPALRKEASEKAGILQAEGDALATKLPPREIFLADFDEGIDFVRHGGAKVSAQAGMQSSEKENTAVHEAGHACAAAVLKASDPVVKATIMRRSRALGYVQYMPETDRVSFSDEQAVTRIIIAMAGRAAQEVYLNKVDTGASNDFEQASDMARRMVTSWGMSRLGQISVGDRGAAPMGGMSGGGSMGYGSNLANEIDAEWRRITRECYKIARYIVETDKERMEYVTKKLLEDETILRPEWLEILERFPSKVDADKVCFRPAAE